MILIKNLLNYFNSINMYKMKLQLVSAGMLVSLVSLAQEKKPFAITGHITGKDNGYMYLQYTVDDKSRKDSAIIQNGKFAFKGEIRGPQLAYLFSTSVIRSMDDPNLTTLFIEPVSMKIELQNDHFKEAKLAGSLSHYEFGTLQAKKDKVQKRWKVVMDTLSAVNKRNNIEYQTMRSWVLRPYNAEISEIESDFIKANPNSYVTAYLLSYSGGKIPDDSVKIIFDRFPEKVKNSPFGKMLVDKWAKQRMGLTGSMATNFTATDINGTSLSLADFKGKYVLLDFWASWCAPCRKGNPHLLQLYSQYKDKGFEIIGVSDDDNKPDAWRKAVGKDGIGVWKHVLRGLDLARVKNGDVKNHPGEISDSKYGITALPTKILIDPSGKIIGRYGGDGGQREEEALDKKLKEIFK
ncbi:MAG: TlpA disulfide reductase family protein [Bacteroidota bacterium]